MVLPEGFALPPLPFLVGLVSGVIVVGGVLAHRSPRVSDRTVLGLVPWIGVGGALHVLYVVGGAPPLVRPLLGTPAVYLATFVLAGIVWLLADVTDQVGGGRRTLRVLGGTGLVAFVAALGFVGLAAGELHPTWSLVGLVGGVILTATTWALLWWRWPEALITTGRTGTVVLFGHALDAASTAVGVDILGFGERTPASRLLIEATASIPAPEALGTTWLFVLVKLAVAGMVVVLFADLVRDHPSRGNLLLVALTAVGLGPGTHNLVLYAVG